MYTARSPEDTMATFTSTSLRGKLILIATVLASAMAFLDGTVVNIAIPVIQAYFSTTISGIQWVINSYVLLLAALILISGSLGDRFGRKKIFVYGIALFIIASFLCGFSRSINALIFFRGLQGIGAAMMIPGSLSIINTAFPENERGKTIGLWSGFAGGVAALGPFLGGWLVQTFGWASIFFINIPIGLLALIITLRFVPESKNETTKELDIVGTLTLFLGLLGIAYALIEAPLRGLTDTIIMTSFLAGVILLSTFIIQEKRSAAGLIPAKIFSSQMVIGANLATLFLYFALNGVIFFFILNLQQLQHFSPLLAGISMLPSILLITFFSGFGGSLGDKIGARLPMIVGPLLVSIGMFSFLFGGTQANYFVSYLPGLVLFGIGMALTIAPLTKSAMTVEQKYSGAASGVNNAVARVAALLAIALLGAVMAFVFSQKLTMALNYTKALSAVEKQMILVQKNKIGEIQIPSQFTTEQRMITRKAIDDAFLDSFRIVISIGASLALLSACISYFTIRNKA